MTEACSPPKPGLDGLFDCNICLETASEPVVTLCGHLYCWGCIWRWLEVQECPQCPICKSSIAQERMLPIYGRGRPQVDPRSHTHDAGEAIPTRPPAASRASAAAPASEGAAGGSPTAAGASALSSAAATAESGFDVVASLFGLRLFYPASHPAQATSYTVRCTVRCTVHYTVRCTALRNAHSGCA